ncbi:MAG: L,D-transpeptidase [Methyloceanibacter sp.]|uniref:L,D-transpeptidase n=1 Tax=Methyloceanibacter sp. TaxID=1965321 RepID=UPI003D9B1A47
MYVARTHGDLSGQPLTRLDCVKAGMKWNDSANVCGTTPAVVTILKPDARDESSQPLARNQCEMAGLRWNDQANVCGEPAGAATQVATGPAASTVLINIDKTRQRMTVLVDGAERYAWPVSTGLLGYSTPSGVYTASSMNEMWYSKERG